MPGRVFSDALGLGREVWQSPVVEVLLFKDSTLQELLSGWLKCAMKSSQEGQSFISKNGLVLLWLSSQSKCHHQLTNAAYHQ